MEFKILYQELVNSTEMIRSLLAGVSQKEAQVKPTAKSWSILEVVCHLHDEEREDFRFHLDWILKQTGEEWPGFDPQGWIKQRKYNQQNFASMKSKFFRERKKSLVWLKTIESSKWNIRYEASWGTLSAGDMFASWVAHDNLHIRQFVELRRARMEKISKPYNIRYAGEW